MNQELREYIFSNLPEARNKLINNNYRINAETFTSLEKVFNQMSNNINFDKNVEILKNNSMLLSNEFNRKIKDYLHDKETIYLSDKIIMDDLPGYLSGLYTTDSVTYLTGRLDKLGGIGKRGKRPGPSKRRPGSTKTSLEK